MGLLNQRAGNHRAVLQHILQVHQVTIVHVLGIIVRVVEMDNASFVGRHNVLGQQNPAGNILTDLACHIVTLHGVDGGVLVGVLLLDFFVVAFNQAENPVIGGIGLTGQAADITICNIFLGDLKGSVGHDRLLHQILNFLHRGAVAHFLTGNLDALPDSLNLQRSQAHLLFHGIIGLGHSHQNLVNIKNNFCAIALDNLHGGSSLGTFSI